MLVRSFSYVIFGKVYFFCFKMLFVFISRERYRNILLSCLGFVGFGNVGWGIITGEVCFIVYFLERRNLLSFVNF